jgi:hypothetical protein
MKWQRVFEAVAISLLVSVLGAAVSTYIEVQILRADVLRLEKQVDDLWIQANNQIQKLDKEKRDR